MYPDPDGSIQGSGILNPKLFLESKTFHKYATPKHWKCRFSGTFGKLNIPNCATFKTALTVVIHPSSFISRQCKMWRHTRLTHVISKKERNKIYGLAGNFQVGPPFIIGPVGQKGKHSRVIYSFWFCTMYIHDTHCTNAHTQKLIIFVMSVLDNWIYLRCQKRFHVLQLHDCELFCFSST